jgi:hypothetical protein
MNSYDSLIMMCPSRPVVSAAALHARKLGAVRSWLSNNWICKSELMYTILLFLINKRR